jgi:hypothetical protein
MGDTLPGAFPEDEASVITTEDVFKPREILIDFKAQREIDRKVKEAGNPKRTFRVTQAEPGALTGKENPRIPPGNHLSRRFQVLVRIRLLFLVKRDGILTLCLCHSIQRTWVTDRLWI